MNSQQQRIKNVLDKIVSIFQSITPNLPCAMASTGGQSLSFMEGYPVSTVDVIDNDDELAERKEQNNQGITSDIYFFDRRNNRIYMFNKGWTYTVYKGKQSFLRPKTLCFSPYKHRFYYCDEFFRLTRITLTRSAVAS